MSSTSPKRTEAVAPQRSRLSVQTSFAKPFDPEEERKRLREFGVVMTLALVVIGGIFLYQGKAAVTTWCAISGSFFLVPALGAPRVLRMPEKYWMKLGEKLSVVMTFVVVAVTFFAVLTPIALIGRLVGKRFLELGFDPKRESYWEPSDSKGSGSRHYLPY